MGENKHTITDQEYFNRLGQRIKKMRMDADFPSAEAFAGEVEINRNQYRLYEKGKNMNLATLRKIAAIHKKSIEEVLKGLEDNDFMP